VAPFSGLARRITAYREPLHTEQLTLHLQYILQYCNRSNLFADVRNPRDQQLTRVRRLSGGQAQVSDFQ